MDKLRPKVGQSWSPEFPRGPQSSPEFHIQTERGNSHFICLAPPADDLSVMRQRLTWSKREDKPQAEYACASRPAPHQTNSFEVFCHRNSDGFD